MIGEIIRSSEWLHCDLYCTAVVFSTRSFLLQSFYSYFSCYCNLIRKVASIAKTTYWRNDEERYAIFVIYLVKMILKRKKYGKAFCFVLDEALYYSGYIIKKKSVAIYRVFLNTHREPVSFYHNPRVSIFRILCHWKHEWIFNYYSKCSYRTAWWRHNCDTSQVTKVYSKKWCCSW